MAQRLATEYVKTCLVLDEAELLQLLQLFHNQSFVFKMKVLDNGDQEIVFEDSGGSDFVLTFERKCGKYVYEGSCRLTDLKLANAMRRAVSQFKGDAVVNRIYKYYTLQYQYQLGAVVRITELSKQGERLVYERKEAAGDWMRAYRSVSVEGQIEKVRSEVDELLDRRNGAGTSAEISEIDKLLRKQAHQLFVLEA